MIENDPNIQFDRRVAIPKMDPVTGALKYIIEERPPPPPPPEPEPEPEPFVPLVELEPPEPREIILEAIKLREEDWKSLPEEEPETLETADTEPPSEGNLRILIEEEEHGLLTHDGVIEEYKASGELHILNHSEKDRVWDVDLLLGKIPKTTIEHEKIHVTEIPATSSKAQRYAISTNKPVLDIQEKVTTFGKIGENQTLIMETPTEVTFHITVRNTARHTLTEVLVSKVIPIEFEDVYAIKASEGDTDYRGEHLLWTIPQIAPDATLSLIFKAKITAQRAEPIRSGVITVDYQTAASISELRVGRFGAFSRNMYYIEADESDQPGVWTCRLIFNNRSDFTVDLLVVEVTDPDTNEKYLEIKNDEEYIVPGGAWVSKEWKVKKSQRPSFIQRCDFTVVPMITLVTRGHLNMRDLEMPVAALEAEKHVDMPSVPSYVKTPIEVTIKVRNIGSAPLNALDIRDEIPAVIVPPKAESITASVMGKRMSRDTLAIDLDPTDHSADHAHQLRIKLRNLKDTVGLLNRGESIKFTYPIVVENPAPNQKFELPVTVSGQSYPPGPYIEALSMGDLQFISVAHTPRRFTIGKSVEPFGATGNYEIGIMFKNRGDAVLKQLLIQDQVPENFDRTNFSIKPHVVQVEGRHLLQWFFPIVSPNQKIEIDYEIHGTGAYRPKAAQVFYDVGDLIEPGAADEGIDEVPMLKPSPPSLPPEGIELPEPEPLEEPPPPPDEFDEPPPPDPDLDEMEAPPPKDDTVVHSKAMKRPEMLQRRR